MQGCLENTGQVTLFLSKKKNKKKELKKNTGRATPLLETKHTSFGDETMECVFVDETVSIKVISVLSFYTKMII